MNALTTIDHAATALSSPIGANPRELFELFFAGRNPRTLAAYQADLEDFRAFVKAPDLNAAGFELFHRGHGPANGLALSYRAHMVERRLQPATINRRLAALRSFTKLANTVGAIGWELSVENVKSQKYRDTRGPGRRSFDAMLALSFANDGAKGVRDTAILRLLHDMALRRGEVVALDLEDLRLDEERLFILGKGRTEKEPLTIPAKTKAALEAWLVIRGMEPGPLFTSLDRAKKGSGRLTGAGVYAIVSKLGHRVGVKTRPHGLRHLAITEGLDRTQGDIRAVQRFSRHKDVRVLSAYDDNREDLGGRVASLVAD
jgi:integrase/recombinase XerC